MRYLAQSHSHYVTSRDPRTTPWTICVSINLCTRAIFPACVHKKPGRRGPPGPQTVSGDAFFTVHVCENRETLTARQRHQTNDYFPFKEECLHMLSFHVSFSSSEKKNLVRVFSRPMRCCVCACLPPSPYCFMFAYLFAFTYSYLRFERSFLAS